MNQSIEVAGIVVVGWVISVCFHEFGHAIVAYAGGDKSVKSKGYLYFNPFAYTDIRLSIILPTIFVMIGGIGLPGASVQIRDDQLRSKYWLSLVSAAGPFFTLLFSIALWLVIQSGVLPDTILWAACWLLNLELVVFILNLLPIPGLDGFGIIEPFLSRNMQAKLRPYYKIGFPLLIALMWIPGPNHILWLAADVILLLAGIPQLMVMKGEYLYREGAFPVASAVIVVALIAYTIKQRNDWQIKAEKLIKAAKYQECLDLIQVVLAKRDDAMAYKFKALALAGLATKAADEQQAGKFKKESIEAIDKCISLDPKIFEFWLAKGIICEVLGELDDALQSYDQAIQLNKSNSQIFVKYCEILWQQKKYDEILQAADKRIDEKLDDGQALFQKGTALGALNRPDEAYACFEKCERMGVQRELCLKNMDIIKKAKLST